MRRTWREKGGLIALIALFAACSVQRQERPPLPIPPIGELSQRTLLPSDPYAEARVALAQRVISRERHFREAYEPGFLWRWLRVEQADIDAGRVSPAELVDIGRELFGIDFGPAQGLGNGLSRQKSPLGGPHPAPNLRHVHYKEFGGPDATRCLACHHMGGDGGGGFRADNAFLDGDGQTPASALERNPPSLAGVALLQLLAAEMTAELQEQYRVLVRDVLLGGKREVPLSAKGVSFGVLRLTPAGRPDPAGLRGVDPDLVVRPLGRKGTTATLREMVERSLQQNLGIQPESWIHRDPALVGDGPEPADPDADGVTREATEGMVSALSTYLAALSPPIEEMPEDPAFLLYASRGAELFQQIGCASCHVPELPLDGTVVGLGPTPRSQPRLDLAPLLTPPIASKRTGGVPLYSDLKRHDMGPALSEPRPYHGVKGSEWLTPPLWGVSASGPYLHDGRASTLELAILAHEGEARAAAQAYVKLSAIEQGKIHTFLMVLDRPHHLEFRR